MKSFIAICVLFFISSCSFSQEMQKEEGRYYTPPFTIDYVMDIGPTAETYPGFLKNRGDFRKLKEISGNGKGIKVGIVDTGLDYTHSREGGELQLYNPDKPNATGVAVKAVKDFTASRNSWRDTFSHGTHVAGHIGARANGSGIEGIASECDLYIAKGLGDRGFGTDSQISSAIYWLLDQKVDIINLSLGGGKSPGIEAAVKKAYEEGVLVFAALGNDGERTDGHPGNSIYTYGIAAVDYNLNVASFSSRSDRAVYSGYGVNIFSTISNGRYAQYSGTSMATPDQCGVAALVLGYSRKIGKPINNMIEYGDFVQEHIKDIGRSGWDRETGFGFIEADKVLVEVAPDDPLDPPIDPEDPVDPPIDPEDPADPFDGFKKVGEFILNNTKYLLLEEVK